MIELSEIVCSACNVTFGINTSHLRNIKNYGQKFYCPNGHELFFGESEKDKKLKAYETELAREKAKYNRLSDIYNSNRSELGKCIRQLNSTKGVITRMKRRLVKGLCPMCGMECHNIVNHIVNSHNGLEY